LSLFVAWRWPRGYADADEKDMPDPSVRGKFNTARYCIILAEIGNLKGLITEFTSPFVDMGSFTARTGKLVV
jgi:hypothetical protein